MLGDADRVAIGDLGHGDALVHGGLEVGMVRADACRDDELELLGLVEALLRHVSGPERLGNHDLGVGKMFLEFGIRTILVRGDDELVAGLFEELAKSKLSRDAAEQLARLEVDRARGRRRHAARIVIDLRNVVPRIVRRIAGYGIVVENTENFSHGSTPSWAMRASCQASACAHKRTSTTCCSVAVAQELGVARIAPFA